jgi:hypothetical protein
MHCNNENWFGIFFYLPYRGVPFDSEAHRVYRSTTLSVIYSVHVILL